MPPTDHTTSWSFPLLPIFHAQKHSPGMRNMSNLSWCKQNFLWFLGRLSYNSLNTTWFLWYSSNGETNEEPCGPYRISTMQQSPTDIQAANRFRIILYTIWHPSSPMSIWSPRSPCITISISSRHRNVLAVQKVIIMANSAPTSQTLKGSTVNPQSIDALKRSPMDGNGVLMVKNNPLAMVHIR